MKRIRIPVLSLSMGKKRFRVYPKTLLVALKGADALEYGHIQVGAKPLRELLSCLVDLDCPLEVKANGRLEVKTITEKKGCKHWFALEPGAWLPDPAGRIRWGQRPKPPITLVVLVPKVREG